MAVGLNADTDWGNRDTDIGGVGHANFTLAAWLYRESGHGHAAVAHGGIMSVAHLGNGRHLSLKFDGTFGGGTENDPKLIIEDQLGEIVEFTTNPPFDAWVFYILRSAGAGGTVTAEWTDDDGASWETASGTNRVEGSVQGQTVLLGRTNVGEANTTRGRYAFMQAINSHLSESASRALIYKSATDSTEWAFWPLADNADTGDDSGNARTMTFNGSFTSESDPTIPSQANVTSRTLTSVISVRDGRTR